MRFGTYMLIGSICAGVVVGDAISNRHAKCPKEIMELDWSMLQIAAVWPALFPLAVQLPRDLPSTPCKGE